MFQRCLFAVLFFMLVSSVDAQPPAKTRVDLLGDPLPQGAVARLGTLRLKHDPARGAVIETIAFSPDGTIIVSRDGQGSGRIHLWDAATGRNLPGPWSDDRATYAFAFSPDGATFAAVFRGGNARKSNEIVLWDIATAKPIKTLSGPNYFVQSIAFADGGKTLVAAGFGAVGWWDVALGKELRVWRPLLNEKQMPKGAGNSRGDSINCMLSPDGISLAVAVGGNNGKRIYYQVDGGGSITGSSYDPTGPLEAMGFNLTTKSVTWRTKAKDGELSTDMRFAFSADGKRLAIADNPDKLQLRDAHSGKLVGIRLLAPKKAEPAAPQATRLAVLETGTYYSLIALQRYYNDFRPVVYNGKLALSPNANLAATIDSHGQVVLWSQNDPNSMSRLPLSKGAWPDLSASAVAFSPDGKKVVVATGASLAVFDVDTLLETVSFDGHHRTVDFLTFSRDSKRLVTANSQVIVGLNNPLTWDTFTWKALPAPTGRAAELPPGGICSPDQTVYAVVNKDNRYCLYGMHSGKLVGVLSRPKYTNTRSWDEIDDLVVLSGRFNRATKATAFFSPDSKYFVAAGTDTSGTSVQLLYSTSSGKLLGMLPSQGHSVEILRPLAFSGDGRLVATFNPADSRIHVFDIVAAKFIHRLGNPPQGEDRSSDAAHLAFTQDGKLLASWSAADNVVRIWDMATGKQRMMLPDDGEEHFRIHLAWSPDGRTLAVADRKVRLWEVAAMKLRRDLTGFGGDIHALDFSPDGQFLATASADTTVLIWDLWRR